MLITQPHITQTMPSATIITADPSAPARNPLLAFLSFAILSLLLITTSGCVAAGAAATIFAPPQKVEARYKPSTRPMAVVVESYRLQGNYNAMRDTLASHTVRELRANKVAEVIDAYKIYDLRNFNPKTFRAMTIDEIGRKVSADQVLYIDLLSSNVTSGVGANMVRADLAALVKIVDSKTGKTLWPTAQADGYLINIDIPYNNISEDRTASSTYDALALAGADQIAKLFYTYTIEE